MDKYNNELEFKNHLPFFDNLNDDLKELRQCASECAKKINKLPEYYEVLSNLSIHYDTYIDSKTINSKLEEIEQVVYSTEFDIFIRKVHSRNDDVNNEKDMEFYKEMLKARKDLKECHKLIMEGLHLNELIPKLIEKPQRMSDKETDPDKKQYYQDLEAGGLI